MKRFLFGAVAALVLALPSTAYAACDGAGDGEFQFNSGTNGKFDFLGQWNCDDSTAPQLIGALGFTTTASTPFHIFCVDADHYAQSTPYRAFATEIVFGNALLGTQTRHSYATYWEAAWLVQNYFNLGGVYSGDASAWQNAIWNLTDATACDAACTTRRDNATAAFALSTGTEWAGWYVITDVGFRCETGAPDCGPQEFIGRTVTGPQEIVPEPATMSLLAMGLAGMAGAGMRRRKK